MDAHRPVWRATHKQPRLRNWRPEFLYHYDVTLFPSITAHLLIRRHDRMILALRGHILVLSHLNNWAKFVVF